MNSKKHKLPRRILAMLLAICMFVTMFPSAMFAVEDGGDSDRPATRQTESVNVENHDNNIEQFSKSATRTGENTWDIDMTVKPETQIQSVPMDVILVIDKSNSMKEYVTYNETRMDVVKTAAQSLVDQLEKVGNVNVGLASFNFSGSTERNLTALNDSYGYGNDRRSGADIVKEAIRNLKYDSKDEGGTNITEGLEQAEAMLKQGSEQSSKVVILLSDGANSNDEEDIKSISQASSMKQNGITIYTVGFAYGDGTDANTLKAIANENGFYRADDTKGLVNVFTQIANKIIAMVTDSVGNDVSISGDVTASVDGSITQGDSFFRWNPDEETGLSADETLNIDYSVTLNKTAQELWNDSAQATVTLNDSAYLTYRVGDNGPTTQLELDSLTTTVDLAKLTVFNNIDGEEVSAGEDEQVVFVYADKQQPFNWVDEKNNIGNAQYTGSKLFGPDGQEITAEEFETYAPTEKGTYKLVHEYSTVNSGNLDVQIYVDGNPMTINGKTDLEKYLSGLTATGQTAGVSLSYNEGKVNVSYNYETYDSADLQFNVNDAYVLQAVDGEFIIGEKQWDGVKNKDGVTTVDNVAGNSTLKIYLNTPYTVDYHPSETGVTDDNTYIVSAQKVSAPKFPSNPTDDERSQGYKGGWADASLLTEVKLAYVPDTYIGWYTTENGDTKHENSYSEGAIAAAAGDNTVIECYAREVKPAITGIDKQVVTGPVEDVEGINWEDYQYPTAVESGNPQLTVDEGTNVTLLYTITVTGEKGAGFSVSESRDNAKLVKVVGATKVDESVEGALFTGTLDGETATLYVSVDYGVQNTVGSKALENTATVTNTDPDADEPDENTATETVDEEVTPKKPDVDEVIEAFGDQIVTIDCVNTTYQHKDVQSALLEGSFNIGDVKKDNGIYTVQITVTPTDAYATAYNDVSDVKTHTLVAGQIPTTLTLTYDNEQGWTAAEGQSVTVQVTCPNEQDITAFEKRVLTQDEVKDVDLENTYDNPVTKDGTVVVNEGESATLLYAITIKGDANTEFEVTDPDTTLVKAVGVEIEPGTQETYTGKIPAEREVTLYVSKTFNDITEDTETLDNTATISNKDSGEVPNKGEVTVEVPVDVVPQAPDVVKLLGDAAVKVDCVNPNVGHGDKDPATYGLLNETYELKPSEDGLHYTVTITDAQAYVEKYNETLEGHELVAGPEGEISLNYKGNGEWEISGAPLLIKVTCPEVHFVDTFEKSIVTRDEAEAAAILNESNQDTYTFPDNEGKVTVTEGDDATLLYKITVKGTPGTSVTVTDDGTTLVKAVGLANIGPNSPYEFKLPDTGEATLYVSKIFTNIQKDEQAQDQQTLDNTATIVNNDNEDKIPDDGKTEENVPVDVEPVSAFVKTVITTGDIDTLPEDLKTRTDIVFPTKNEDGSIEQVVVPQGGSVTLLYAIKVEGGDGDTFTVKDTGADLVYAGASDVTEDTANDTFSGTIDKSGSVQFYVIRTFSSDEVKDQKLTNSATLTSEDIDLEPGDEEQEEDVPAEVGEGLIVTVKPADVTSYEGGDGGYDGVVDEDNSEVEGENSPSLPHPMFYIDAPEDVDPAGLTFVNGDKVWTVKEDGLDGDETNPRMLYHFVEGAEQEPVRVTYTYVNHQTGVETTVTSDNLDELENVADVYTYLRIDLYAGENDVSDVKASINGTSYAIKAESGQLTVRAVEADNPSDVTSDIQATAPVEDGTADTAVAVEPANTTYTFNDTEVELPEDSNPSLLFDNIIDDSVNRTAALEAKADQKLNADADDYNYEIMYLDLVDTNNGNAWITSSEGTDIYWDYPEGTDRNTDFEILHFTGLHREDSETTDSGFEIEDLESISMDEIENVTIKEKTDDYIVFHVTEANFSPYAIAWETDNGGSDTPDNPGWTPGGSGDEPDGLNTEDHFSYIVGYAEDYRTGEPTDNEDLWPVKPNNQITRAEVATIFYRLLEDEVRDEYDTTVNDFSDVSADSWYNQTVSTLASMEIVKGYEDGTFRPNAPITRAEFGAIATRFFAETGATYEPGTFSDVTGDEWYANAIQDAVNLGLIGGYPDGTVRPNNNITRAEACAIVNRTLGRVPDADHLLPDDVMKTWPDNPESAWFYADMQEATNGHEYSWITEDGNEVEEWTDLLDKDWTDR